MSGRHGVGHACRFAAWEDVHAGDKGAKLLALRDCTRVTGKQEVERIGTEKRASTDRSIAGEKPTSRYLS
jgi:hypothetical protein